MTQAGYRPKRRVTAVAKARLPRTRSIVERGVTFRSLARALPSK